VRLLTTVALFALLAACTPEPPAVPSPSIDTVAKVAESRRAMDSRVAASVAVAREANAASQPPAVESELSVAAAYLPKPTDADIAIARSRVQTAALDAYDIARADAAKKQAADNADWSDLAAQAYLSEKNTKRLNAEIVELKNHNREIIDTIFTGFGAFCIAIGVVMALYGQLRLGFHFFALGLVLVKIPAIIASAMFLWAACGIAVLWAGCTYIVHRHANAKESKQ